MQLTIKEQDYLETIYLLSLKSRLVALSDVARERGVALPTVSSVLSRLKSDGLVKQPFYGKISLSPAGRELGTAIYAKHRIIRELLQEVLLLPSDVAEKTACEMEHGISPEAVRRLELFMNTVRSCPLKDSGCLAKFSKRLSQWRDRE